MATDIVIRTGLDRLRYALLFEGILVVALSVAMAMLFDRSLFETGALSITLSLVALAINFIYNYAFDKFDLKHGRVPTERTVGWRVVHALGFETTLVLMNLPVFMVWMGWSIGQALLFDVAAMAAIVVYTYFFTLAYDHLFPVAQPGAPLAGALDSDPVG